MIYIYIRNLHQCNSFLCFFIFSTSFTIIVCRFQWSMFRCRFLLLDHAKKWSLIFSLLSILYHLDFFLMIFAIFTIHTRSFSLPFQFFFFFNETELFTLHLIRYLHLSLHIWEKTQTVTFQDFARGTPIFRILLMLILSFSFSLCLRLLSNISLSHPAFPRAFF